MKLEKTSQSYDQQIQEAEKKGEENKATIQAKLDEITRQRGSSNLPAMQKQLKEESEGFKKQLKDNEKAVTKIIEKIQEEKKKKISDGFFPIIESDLEKLEAKRLQIAGEFKKKKQKL